MKITNFAAGPSQLSTEIIKQLLIDIPNYKDTGLSICEINHFSEEWKELYLDIINNTKIFLEIPGSYDCFYMTGGATHQFSVIVYNFCTSSSKIQILITGYWSNKAALEMEKKCHVRKVYKEEDLIDSDEFVFTYFCDNETIIGYELRNGLNFFPKKHFIVCDTSSILGSKRFNYIHYGIIFSSLSKNLGITGESLIIYNKNIINTNTLYQNIPITLSWIPFMTRINSPTPNIFSIYVTNANLNLMIKNGGLNYYIDKTLRKSTYFYDYLDNSEGFYKNTVEKKYRSRTNITFIVNNSIQTSELFHNFSKNNGFLGIKHHKFDPNKGCRISLYNAIEIHDVFKFTDLMDIFKHNYLNPIETNYSVKSIAHSI